METSGTKADPVVSVDSDLARVVDVVTARLRTGTVSASELINEFPEYADRLERLLPAMAFLADLSKSAGQSPAGIGTPRTDEGEPLPGILGDFRIIREIGRGGMGVVYEAEQISLNRRVALKVLPFAATMDPKQLQRFRNEAKAAASLHHEHVVPVYGVGCERGVHYYAMQFIDGTTLADVINHMASGGRKPPEFGRNRVEGESVEITPGAFAPGSPVRDTAPLAALSTQRNKPNKRELFRQAADWIAQAAEALEYAHSMGIVHRDVKPGNLMVDGSGKLWVADFGLARFGPDAGLTMTGDLLGTLRYMAPEQALAKHGLADHRVDVYGLGCTLYELLTGKPAVGGEDKAEIVRHIAFEEPVAPRKLDKAIPAELETIALKCLAKNPNERYATAGELAADIRHWLADLPIRARRPTVPQRLGRWARRHPGLTATLGLAVGLLLAGAWAWNRETTHADSAARAVAAEADQLRNADRLPEALAVARRAADLLPRFGGDTTSRRVIWERVADLQLLNQLEEARLEQIGEHTDGKRFDLERAVPLFRQAFLDYGVDVIGGDEPAVVEALRRPVVAPQLALAIFEWGPMDADPAAKERLRRLAEALDSDSRQFVSRLRRAEVANDLKSLKALAAEAEVDPPPPPMISELVAALNINAETADAERLLRDGQQRYPANFWINFELAYCLSNMGPTRAAEAVRFYSVALALRPLSGLVWSNLANALGNAGRHGEAEAASRRAIALSPNFPFAHINLGLALRGEGRLAEAEAAYRRAVELKPGTSEFLRNLAILLIEQDRLAEAEATCRQAIKASPNYAEAYSTLSAILGGLKRYQEAEAVGRRSLELKPDDHDAQHNLGEALLRQGKFVAAESYLRAAIKSRPDDPDSHLSLGQTLLGLGRYVDALEELRVCDQGQNKKNDPEWSDLMHYAERMAALEPRLPGLLAGEDQPAGAGECLTLAGICQERKRLFAAAARFYTAAFAADTKLAEEVDSHRYNAACAAALAGCGQGNDADKLDDAQRSRLRQQALDWLTADFAAWTKVADKPAEHPKVRAIMAHWQKDADFAGVRGAEALAKLPKAERVAWQKFWADVAGLQNRCEEPIAPEKPPPKP